MQSQAQAALGAIFNAIKMCRQDFGLDPGSVEELERLDYLVLSDDLKQYWSFRLVGHNPITQIYAESTDQFPPGPGYTIIFTAQTGVFSGYGISEDLTNLLTCVFQSIRLGVEHYVSDHQQYPVSMDVLLAQNYVRISPDLLAGWDFIPVH